MQIGNPLIQTSSIHFEHISSSIQNNHHATQTTQSIQYKKDPSNSKTQTNTNSNLYSTTQNNTPATSNQVTTTTSQFLAQQQAQAPTTTTHTTSNHTTNDNTSLKGRSHDSNSNPNPSHPYHHQQHNLNKNHINTSKISLIHDSERSDAHTNENLEKSHITQNLTTTVSGLDRDNNSSVDNLDSYNPSQSLQQETIQETIQQRIHNLQEAANNATSHKSKSPDKPSMHSVGQQMTHSLGPECRKNQYPESRHSSRQTTTELSNSDLHPSSLSEETKHLNNQIHHNLNQVHKNLQNHHQHNKDKSPHGTTTKDQDTLTKVFSSSDPNHPEQNHLLKEFVSHRHTMNSNTNFINESLQKILQNQMSLNHQNNSPLPDEFYQNDIKGIKQDNRLLQDELKIAKSRIDLLEKQLNNSALLTSTASPLHRSNKLLLNRPDSNLSDLENMDKESDEDDLRHPNSDGEDSDERSEIRQTYLRQIERLKDKISKLENANNDIDEQLNKRENDINKLRQMLKNEQHSFEDEIEQIRLDYDARERNLKKDIHRLKEQLDDKAFDEQKSSAVKYAKQRQYELQEELDQALEKNDQLSLEIRKLRDATRQLTEEVKETSKKLGMSEARVLELEKKNEQTYEKNIECQNRIDELENRLKDHLNISRKHEEDLESVYRDLEQAKLEKIAMSERVQQLDRERLELIDQLDAHTSEKESFLKRIREIEEKQEEALCARDALATEAQHLHDKRAQLEAELKDSEVDIRELNRRIEIQADQKKALEKQNEDLKISQTKSDQERLSLNSQVREAQWQKDAQQRKIIGLEFQVNRRDKEIERLQHFVQQRQAQQQTLAAMTGKDLVETTPPSPKGERINKAMSMELEKLRDESIQYTKNIQELEHRNTQLQNELKRIDADLENELREKSKLSTDILQIDKLKKELREKEDNYERQLNEHTRFIDRLKGNLTRSENRREVTEEKIIVLEQERMRLVRSFEEAQTLLKDKGVEIDKLNIKVSTCIIGKPVNQKLTRRCCKSCEGVATSNLYNIYSFQNMHISTT